MKKGLFNKVKIKFGYFRRRNISSVSGIAGSISLEKPFCFRFITTVAALSASESRHGVNSSLSSEYIDHTFVKMRIATTPDFLCKSLSSS